MGLLPSVTREPVVAFRPLRSSGRFKRELVGGSGVSFFKEDSLERRRGTAPSPAAPEREEGTGDAVSVRLLCLQAMLLLSALSCP